MQNKWKGFWAIIGLCVLGALALIRIAYASVPPSNSSTFIEVTKTLFLCLGGIGVIMPLYLSVVNAMEDRTFKKIENTFNLLARWDDPHLLKARRYTRKIGKSRATISDDQLLKEIAEDEALEESIILVGNYFEHVRFSIELNRIDKVQFKKALGPTIIGIIDRFTPFYNTLPAQTMTDLEQLKSNLR